MDNAHRYEQLEQGARYLASLEADDCQRQVHLGWANRYRRLASDAKVPGNPVPFQIHARCS